MRDRFSLDVSWLGLALLALPGCRAAQAAPDLEQARSKPYVPLPDPEPETIGYFLALFDKDLEQWSERKLTAVSAQERRTVDALERNLEKRAQDRREEILAAFESGPPINRRIAAAALGFTHDASMLSPLLSGLSDSDAEVVQKSLLGLGILALPETPLAEIRFHMLQHPDPWTRNNAAFALLRIADAGGSSPDLAEGCRQGLLDSEPGVRAQCASALGILVDGESVDELASLLYDDFNLVALAAAAALARIGRLQPEHKGAVARHLVDSLDRVRADRRQHVLNALVWMSDRNLGEDTGPWREWAYRLP